MKEKYYVSTPIYYPNDMPHIGHAYTSIVVDTIARWQKLLGKDVLFTTGTDDHGKKIAEVAKNAGKKPKEFVDALIPHFKDAWEKLNIKYDKFIRTTDKDHEAVVQEVLQKSFDNGDIYLGEYEGLYCTGCEAYYTEKDLVDGKCPLHPGEKIEKLKEQTYFFKLSKYQDKLLELYENNKNFLLPNKRKQEIINRVKEGLRDVSISRTNFDWGVPLPFDKKHVCYVWFDALFNYYSATRSEKREKFWPCDLHIIGKDISWFHMVYWPAFLMSVGLPPPKSVFAHGWWTFGKEKISKSQGKVINVDELISIAGVDSARYFLLRNASFGEDGEFSEEALISRHNGELVNKLGNLISRTAGLIEKDGMEKTKNSLKIDLERIKELFEKYEFDKVLNEIFSFVDRCNEYLQKKKPWETHDKKVLYEVADAIKQIAILLYPFIPESSEKIAKQFKFKIDLKELEKPLSVSKIQKKDYLFKRVEQKVNKELKIKEIMENVAQVEFEDWAKLDLRVAQIKKVEGVEGADKLYKLSVDLGSEKRTICAGLKEYYSAEELKGMKIIIIANLKPKKMKGIESQGMLLAASNEDQSKVVLIGPTKDVELGSKVS